LFSPFFSAASAMNILFFPLPAEEALEVVLAMGL